MADARVTEGLDLPGFRGELLYPGTALNFIGQEVADRVEAAFGPEKYEKLRELKKKWDPRNLFRHNQNIPPAA